MSVFEESASYRPFSYPWAAEAAQKQFIDLYWDVHEVNLQDDIQQYFSKDGLATKNVSHECNKNIQDRTLCLFTEMDRTVGGGYIKLLQYIKNNEIRNMLLSFGAKEVVHQRAYALCAETFGFSDDDWKAFAQYKEMVEKLEVMGKDIYEDVQNPKLKAAILSAQIALGEGIGLFGAFAVLLNMKRHGLLIGFNDVNQWSLVDENGHIINNIRLVKTICDEDLTEEEISIMRSVILKFVKLYKKAEYKYLELVFEMGGAQDLTLEQMKEYIDFLCGLRLEQFGFVKKRRILRNPLPWMDWLLEAEKNSNFFEKKVQEYSHEKLKGSVDYSKYAKLLA